MAPYTRFYIIAASLTFLLFLSYNSSLFGTHNNPLKFHKYTPSSQRESKAIIASCKKEETSSTDWIENLFPDWERYVYLVDFKRTPLHLPMNKGREAAVYLTFIVDHYDNLPETMVFIHGKRWQWHTDDPMYDTAASIGNLSLTHVKEKGYTSLRCTWWPGCPAWLYPELGKKDPKCWYPGCEEGKNDTATHVGGFPQIEGSLAQMFTDFFPGEPVPEKIGAPCCAQFAVTREQVLKRSVEDYKKYLHYMQYRPDPDFKLGAVIEHLWHIMFGQPADMCSLQPAKECHCQRYGFCHLDCPEDGFCYGRYWRIRGFQALPVGWPHVMQGERGTPVYGWWKNETLLRLSMDPNARPPGTRLWDLV